MKHEYQRDVSVTGAVLLSVSLLLAACNPASSTPVPLPTVVLRQPATATPIPSPTPLRQTLPVVVNGSEPVTGTAQSAAAATDTTVLTPTALPFTPTAAASPTVVASPTAIASPTPAPPPTQEPLPRLNLAPKPAMKLEDWPRPASDNGRGMHFLIYSHYTDQDLDINIARLKDLNAKWALVLYGDELQLERAATRFKAAGIVVVWRHEGRPYQRYYDWGRDVAVLNKVGMPPYFQVYNEANLPAEWDGKPIDRRLYLENMLYAISDIYNAGGYPGLQLASDEWLATALQTIKAQGGEAAFGRMFYVPHPYGLNHPPDYTGDSNSVLGWLAEADVFRKQIGFVPPMIAGEGGWKWNATDDHRFPKIDAEKHRDYHVAVFDWFRTGKLSNNQPLPDWFFAFCPWLLSDKLDDSAWYDSFAGNHLLTINAVKAMPKFTRKMTGVR